MAAVIRLAVSLRALFRGKKANGSQFISIQRREFDLLLAITGCDRPIGKQIARTQYLVTKRLIVVIGRIGVNYKFGDFGGPVVARY